MKIPDKAIIKFEYSDENREYIFDIKELYDIIKEKQLIIDKAIEQIEEQVGDEIHDMMYVIDVRDVLDILKGSDKE